LNDPLLDPNEVLQGVIPLDNPGSKNLYELVENNVLSAAAVSFGCMNPNAFTIGGGYVSCSVLPPLHFVNVAKDATGADGDYMCAVPALSSRDAKCIEHTIVGEGSTQQTFMLPFTEDKAENCEHGSFSGYVIVWPGSRLSISVTTDSWRTLGESVDGGYVSLDISNVYFLEKTIVGKNTLDTQVLRLTALRLRTGEFMPHSREFFRYTMAYATHTNIPVK
jgi:hypothetical protein